MTLPEVPLRAGMVVRMRKVHPCGGREWTIIRIGQRVEIQCRTCGRTIQLDIMTLRRQGTRIIEDESGSSNDRQAQG